MLEGKRLYMRAEGRLDRTFPKLSNMSTAIPGGCSDDRSRRDRTPSWSHDSCNLSHSTSPLKHSSCSSKRLPHLMSSRLLGSRVEAEDVLQKTAISESPSAYSGGLRRLSQTIPLDMRILLPFQD